MEDSQLTRLAIEEIVREMHESKECELQATQERKINPMGRPNKRFLDRTLNSVITHNKRENERTQASCRRKLKELDDRRRKRLRKEEYRRRRSSENDKSRKRRSRSESAHEIYSSTSSEGKSLGRSKKLKHKNKNRSKTRSNSKYEGTTDQDVVENSSFAESYNDIEENIYLASDNVTNLAYNLAAYNQMNQFLHYEAILQAGMEAATKTDTENHAVKYEKKIECITVYTSSSSSSSLSSSSPTSSMEEDENGVLTIYLSSDEHSTKSNTKLNGKRKKKRYFQSSVQHFDLNTSSSSSRSSPNLSSSRKTYHKSSSNEPVFSCSSDSDAEVGNKTLAEETADITCPSDTNTEVPHTSTAVPDKPEAMIDLTDD